jgi:hypothetical protein
MRIETHGMRQAGFGLGCHPFALIHAVAAANALVLKTRLRQAEQQPARQQLAPNGGESDGFSEKSG